ncbi:hypothetical protein [Vibrio sp. SCSIO 43136]|uniref:hypothetical protein n=1 Tax=Vibrio sp. SCSIO 43136 TaxID=2819101 RepID=UPI0020762982|nr:hypothetical protein [Vibrio sp. SCSIO 43136]USD66278.1 hypothetical protein J4N39_05535 [Vibrio sp. SCSIO 43136]
MENPSIDVMASALVLNTEETRDWLKACPENLGGDLSDFQTAYSIDTAAFWTQH